MPDKPEKRGIIKAMEFQKYINIVALSEVRFAENSSIRRRQATPLTGVKNLQQNEVNLVRLLQSVMVFSQVSLRIQNQ